MIEDGGGFMSAYIEFQNVKKIVNFKKHKISRLLVIGLFCAFLNSNYLYMIFVRI